MRNRETLRTIIPRNNPGHGRSRIARTPLKAFDFPALDALEGNPTFEAQLAKARKLKAEMERKLKP